MGLTIGDSRLQPVLVSIWLTAPTRDPLRAAFSMLLYANANRAMSTNPRRISRSTGNTSAISSQGLAAGRVDDTEVVLIVWSRTR